MGGQRVPHIIRPNKSGAAPQAWVVFDVRTTAVQISDRKWQHAFASVHATYWRPARAGRRETVQQVAFGDRSEFLAWVCNKVHAKERVGIVSHGLDFSAQVLDIHCALRQLEWRPTRVIIENGRWQQRWRKGVDKEHDQGKTLHWIDLRNFYPARLRDIGKWIGLEVFDHPGELGTNEHWSRYSERRCAVTLRALRLWGDFRDAHDLGYFSPTLAGQAFNAYRHRFMGSSIFVHIHPDVIAQEKRAYFSGRCQALWLGRAPKGDYLQVDITAAYANVMRSNRYPVKQIGHSNRVSLTRLAELIRQYCVIATVTLDTEIPKYPHREAGGVTYPVGKFETTLCTPELAEALKERCVVDVQEVVVYESASLFTEYVNEFWKMRQAAMEMGDCHTVELCKRFLVSLYGKFGQRIWLRNLVHENVDAEDRIWAEYDWQDSAEYEYSLIGGRMERKSREVMGRDTLLAIPAHVTAYGRMQLWRLIEAAGLEHVYYMDTDSLIVSRHALRRLAQFFHANTLGGLRIVRSSPYLFIRAPKWYILGQIKKHGGIQKDAREIRWNVFEFDDTRTMHWNLSHENPCRAIVERVEVTGPLTERLPVWEPGHRVPQLRIGPEPISLPGPIQVRYLPMAQLPLKALPFRRANAKSGKRRVQGA